MEMMLILAILVIGAVRLVRIDDESSDRDARDAQGGTGFAEEPQRSGAGFADSINPATGLPMLLDGPGGFDIDGNMWGFDDETLSMHRHPADRLLLDGAFGDHSSGPRINPATGLPMISDSPASFDVGGNPYGSRSDDVFSHDSPFGSDFGSGSHGISDFHDSFGSGSGSMDSFGSGSSGSGFGSDW